MSKKKIIIWVVIVAAILILSVVKMVDISPAKDGSDKVSPIHYILIKLGILKA